MNNQIAQPQKGAGKYIRFQQKCNEKPNLQCQWVGSANSEKASFNQINLFVGFEIL